MHCKACDKNMSDFESTRKIIHNDGKIEYPDLCNTCFKESGISNSINVVERSDLSHEIDISEDEFYWDGNDSMEMSDWSPHM